MVDDEDYEKFNKFKWHKCPYGYAVRSGRKEENRRGVKLHREVTNCPKGLEVDHINRNKLDNRKENLRIVTRQQNAQNRGKTRTNTSGFRGVFKKGRGWAVQVYHNGKIHCGGSYQIPEDASVAADKMRKHLGFLDTETNYGIVSAPDKRGRIGNNSNNSSGYRGVSWKKKNQKWVASVNNKGKVIHIGLFNNIKDAAVAADNKRKELGIE